MNLKTLPALLMFLATLLTANISHAEELTGDTRLACEAILCLSSSTRPSECNPALNRYYGIKKKQWSKTVQARMNFLNLCPVSSQTSEMKALVSALANGAGNCEAGNLNVQLATSRCDDCRTEISNRMPSYCDAYFGHDYTDFADIRPRYVGTPAQCGYWVEARDYEAALRQYRPCNPDTGYSD